MATITTGSINKALWPGVNKWYGLAYDEYPPQWKEIFDSSMSDKNFEEDVNVYGLGLAPVKQEAGNVAYDEMAQGWTQRYINVTYALGFIISQEAVEDNLYMALAEKKSKALAFSMRQTKENVGAAVLNRAFNANFTFADGIELCSKVNEKSKGDILLEFIMPFSERVVITALFKLLF